MCNLTPALLAKWPGSFSCHCGSTGVERTPNKSQHRKLTLEKKILLPLLPGLELATFRSRVRRSPNKLLAKVTFSQSATHSRTPSYPSAHLTRLSCRPFLLRSSLPLSLSSFLNFLNPRIVHFIRLFIARSFVHWHCLPSTGGVTTVFPLWKTCYTKRDNSVTDISSSADKTYIESFSVRVL